jgi:hypothetical protein
MTDLGGSLVERAEVKQLWRGRGNAMDIPTRKRLREASETVLLSPLRSPHLACLRSRRHLT